MLKEIITLWKGQTFMGRVVEQFGQMLRDAEAVFNLAWGSATGQMIIDKIRPQIYDKDIAVNKHERQIRRMVAEHLSINPRQDTSGCLTMMSLVKDAERIGDYSKNIFELAVIIKGNISEMKFAERLLNIQKKISMNFPKLTRAFLESDENLAKEILEDYAPIKDECSHILQDMLSEELSTREAVATALFSRYLKRINSHMSNIASGIIYPLDKIDFVRTKGGLLE